MKRTIITALAATIFLSGCGSKNEEAKPQYKAITETVFASGTLEPEAKYNLTAQSDGYLVSLNFKEDDVVKAGDVLAVIDNQPNNFNEASAQQLLAISAKNVSEQAPALKQTEENISLAKDKVKQDETQADRYKKLLESNSVSRLEYENAQLALESSRTNLAALEQTYALQKQQAEQQLIAQTAQKNINSFLSDNNQLKAIVGGRIYKKMKERGDYVKKGDVLAVIGNADEIYARLNIDESNISRIKVGQEALVQLNTMKGQSFKGAVSEILPSFDESTQSFICKVRFTDPLTFRISGTQLQANIVTGKKDKALLIPREFLDYGNKVNVDGRDTAVIVKTGFISSDWVEITEGLKEGDVLKPLTK
ncbi:MAG: efflux RND transporter periplasmic adaptor subunit [Bacteroidia bacterium]